MWWTHVKKCRIKKKCSSCLSVINIGDPSHAKTEDSINYKTIVMCEKCYMEHLEMIKEYKAAQLTAFTFIEEQVKPKVRMNDMKVGDIFKTEEGKIMMRVSLVNTMFDHVGTSAYEISKRFTVINLQTGTIWQPINQIRNQVVFPQNAVVHISDKV
jgi:protein-arginine kinase activator protein McsA